MLLRPRGFNVKRQTEGEGQLGEVSVEEIADALERQEIWVAFLDAEIQEVARIFKEKGHRPEL